MSFLGDKVANPIFQLVWTLDTHGTNKYISGGALSFSVWTWIVFLYFSNLAGVGIPWQSATYHNFLPNLFVQILEYEENKWC